MFSSASQNKSLLKASKVSTTTINCLQETEMENQKLCYQLDSMKTAYSSLRKKYQELSSEINDYHRKAIENEEYKDQNSKRGIVMGALQTPKSWSTLWGTFAASCAVSAGEEQHQPWHLCGSIGTYTNLWT